MVRGRRVLLVAALVTASIGAGCGEQRSPSGAAATRREARTALTADELQRLRAALPRLRPGMTRAEVMATMNVDLDGLAQIGTGPQTEATTIYVVGGAEQLDLTWDARDEARPVLLRAALTPRATP